MSYFVVALAARLHHTLVALKAEFFVFFCFHVVYFWDERILYIFSD